MFAWLLFAEEKNPSQKKTVSQSIEKQSLSIKFAHPIEETKYIIEKYALFWLSQTEPSLKYGNATEYRL